MYLDNKRCYLSGPIEHGEDVVNWRTEPMNVLRERFNVDVFNPFDDPKQQWVPVLQEARKNKDYEEMRRIAKSFVRKDLAEVDRSHFLIAYVPYRVPTTGTVHEIINSSNDKKPTMLVCPQGKENVSLWYYGFIPHSMMFGSFHELYEYLDEVNRGEHMNNDRWSVVYGLV